MSSDILENPLLSQTKTIEKGKELIITEIIQKIAHENIDPQMLSITEWYIVGLLIIFFAFLVWIVMRVLARWIRLFVLRRSIRATQKKHKGDLDLIRQRIQDKFIGQIGWPGKNFRPFILPGRRPGRMVRVARFCPFV